MKTGVPYYTIKHLLDESGRIPYETLLSTSEWQQFRSVIIERDNHTCTRCNQPETTKLHPDDNGYFRAPTQQEIDNVVQPPEFDLGGGIILKLKAPTITGKKIENPIILHVHHLYYIFDHLPWQYNNNALVTVCHECHTEIHKTQKIPTYDDQELEEELNLVTCDKCFGTGFLQQYNYFHDGICFKCMGYKFLKRK